ncbi:metabolite traffic protein EboE [Streptomyces sp. 7-21]|jgi:sugar phosphate isomerase/epimerase|uniref:metabolite traffic protein EboE n=1 Tax=Streptomyces sp. 7-21 TaxID=2802283 RepID=UPI00191FA1FF|nr:metabolite traffic protein EboE [Streptomyces sp. 7-21]MBL1067783.1 metabolite traffic protein EboE [Streptomyces sp. 7-21]
MRFTHPDGTLVHLAYCTNVHPTEDVAGLLRHVRRFGAAVREHLGTDRLGMGLWLPAPVAAALSGASGERDLEELKRALDDHGLEVVTLNAFPYQGFHDPQVKKAVYQPDWTQPARLAYTLDCARLLARLLPPGVRRGSVSTLPLGWRAGWHDERQQRARAYLDRLAEGLAVLEEETGRTIRVGLEPEPGCAVETLDDAAERLAGVDARRLGVCLDACHLATGFEDPATAPERLAAAGLPIVKTQASAALHVADPADPATREALAAYAEDRFLHQVRERAASGRVAGRDDLPEALAGKRALPGAGPWRVHYHVPLHADPTPPLVTTHEQLTGTLRALFGGERALTDHVEAETYTWSVLPAGQRPEDEDQLARGLAAELRWVADRLRDIGLKEATA